MSQTFGLDKSEIESSMQTSGGAAYDVSEQEQVPMYSDETTRDGVKVSHTEITNEISSLHPTGEIDGFSTRHLSGPNSMATVSSISFFFHYFKQNLFFYFANQVKFRTSYLET